MTTQPRSKKLSLPFIPVIGVLLLAAALRLYHIDFRALWFDEGLSVTFAHLPWREITHYNLLWQDVNPPIYRQLLGLWTLLVGTSAFTVRWFSGWLGILAIALTVRIGRRLGLGVGAGLAAAALVALAPMQVFFSQEAKGYTFIQVCILLAIWLWLSLLDKIGLKQPGRWPLQGFLTPPPSPPLAGRGIEGVGVSGAQPGRPGKKYHPAWPLAAIWVILALALGSHSTVWLVLAVMTLWTILWARRRLVGWLLVVGTLGAAWAAWFTPIAGAVMQGATRAGAESGMAAPRGPAAYLSAMLRELAAGPGGPDWAGWVLGGILILLAGWGLWRGRIPPRSKWILATWVTVPVLLGMAVQVIVPFFLPRFFLYVVPGLMVMAALGLESLPRRWMMPAGVGALALLMAFPLAEHYTRPSDPAADYRPLAADLAHRIRPGDALIYSYSWQPGLLDTYLPDNLWPTYYLSFFPPETIDEELGGILSRHGRVWLVTYQLGAEDPIHAAGQWLLAHAAAPESTWYGDGQLTLFIGPEAVVNPGPESETVRFDGGRITLTYAPVVARAAPGEPAGLALTWEAAEAIPQRYTVFLHLLGEGSVEPVAQQDSQPVNNLSPTYTWTPGEAIRDYRAVWLPTSLPQGATLRIVVGLYDGDTLERVPVDGGGDGVQIGTLLVDPSTPQW